MKNVDELMNEMKSLRDLAEKYDAKKATPEEYEKFSKDFNMRKQKLLLQVDNLGLFEKKFANIKLSKNNVKLYKKMMRI